MKCATRIAMRRAMHRERYPLARIPRFTLYLRFSDTTKSKNQPYRLFMSMSAFLHTRLAKRRPIPLILVKAYMTFCLPSTLVLRIRRMYWNFLSSKTSACEQGAKEIDA